jgi:23S rRNA (uracil1939-C5)-methyltransferase
VTESKVGDRIEVTIEDIAAGGEGVGKIDGFVLFVPAAAPGDVLEVELVMLKKKYGRGRIVRILKPGRRRVKPPCPVYEPCGGCQFQHLDYDTQLTLKTKMVRDAIEHLGSLNGVEVKPCKGMKSPWSYRNKAQMMVAGRPYLQVKRDEARGHDGPEPVQRLRPYFGFYAQRSHRVVPIDECLIQTAENNHLLQAARNMAERLQWEPFSEKTGKGLLRYVVARTTKAGESLLILVASQPNLPQVKEFLSDLRRRVPHLKGVMLNLNPHPTNVVLGSTTRVIWGQDHLLEEAGGLKFRISPTSFFQVNIWGLETIYRCLDDALPLHRKDAVLDMYCGVGSMALYLARRARRVVGVDSCAPAIEDAIINSDLNELKNTFFTAGATEKVLPRLYQQGERFAAAVLDPPRKGCAPEVLNTIHRMRIPKLVYVSCNPATLARDLGTLKELGYRTDMIQPIDMFPQTYHVESVATLSLVASRTSSIRWPGGQGR